MESATNTNQEHVTFCVEDSQLKGFDEVSLACMSFIYECMFHLSGKMNKCYASI